MNGYKKLKRKELYDAVWSMPISKLAKEYGISDRGLTKVCNRHDIPTPPLGYWAKLQNGHKVNQAPFVGDQNTWISFAISACIQGTKKGKPKKIQKKIQELDEQISSIKFDCGLIKPSPIIKSFLNLYELSKEHNNRLFILASTYERFKLSKDNFKRAVVILNNIEVTTKSLGGKVFVDKNSLVLDIWGGNYEIGITEKITSKVIGKERHGSSEWGWETNILDYEGSNQFSLKFIHSWRMSRGSFNDGTKQRVEDLLPQFFKQVRITSDTQEVKELEGRFASMRLQSKSKRETLEREQDVKKQKMLENLQVQIQAWKKSEEVKQYLTSFMKRALRNKEKIKSIKELNEYIHFVRKYSDKLDPLKEFLE